MSVEPNLSLCVSVIELARVAAARLTVRDATLGFSRLAAPQRTALQTQADRWDEIAGGLLQRWRAQPRGPARQLAAMARSDDELILFALASAPQIDRTLGRAYKSLSGVTELTVGVLLDLASPQLDVRLQLVRHLHGDRALRASGLLELPRRGPAMLDDVVTVAPSAIAALRNEPIAAPGPVAAEGHQLPDELIEVVEAAVQLPRWRAGKLSIVAGPPAEREAVLTVRSALDRRPVWHVADPVSDMASWCRDASLSGAHLVLPWANRLDALRHSAAWTQAAVVIACDSGTLPPESGADSPPVLTTAIRGAATPGLSRSLPPGSVRTALETLGF
ncbi:MAG: hypothetical protein K8M05_13535 [Deltaproteobacteria bacterium]|nr:hypothetical protein [Kofleriaceae bacterium]